MANTDRFKVWADEVSAQLSGAGFTVKEYQGFPIVELPATHEETVRLLKFARTVGCDRRIYAEGMLFVPAGAGRDLPEANG